MNDSNTGTLSAEAASLVQFPTPNHPGVQKSLTRKSRISGMTRPDLPGPQITYPEHWEQGDKNPPPAAASTLTLRSHLAYFHRRGQAERTGWPLPAGYVYWGDGKALGKRRTETPVQTSLAL